MPSGPKVGRAIGMRGGVFQGGRNSNDDDTEDELFQNDDVKEETNTKELTSIPVNSTNRGGRGARGRGGFEATRGERGGLRGSRRGTRNN